MTLTQVVDFRSPIPVFPLPQCLLFPHLVVPLHIFEPRYRQMTFEALDRHGVLAMALFEGEAWRKDYEGRPPIRPMVCVGAILHHEKLSDGTYNLMVHGVCRARVIREVPGGAYRTAILEPSEIDVASEEAVAEIGGRLELLLADEALSAHPPVTALSEVVSEKISAAALGDLLAGALFDDTEDRYALLAEGNLQTRLERLEAHLEALRLRLGEESGGEAG